MKALLAKLAKLEKYSRSLPMTPENQDEFLSFCSLKLLEGRNTQTKDWMFYVDFMRWHLGRNSHTESRFERLTYQTFETNQVATYNEDLLIEKIHSRQLVSRIMRRLNLEERLIINMIYFDDLTQREAADILSATESAVSQRLQNIFSKIKLSENLVNL